MPERDRPVYCTRCGSIVHPGDNFCGVCGTRASPAARDAGPPGEVPTRAYPGVPGGGTDRTLALVAGLGVALLLFVGVGTVVALTLLGDGSETADPARSAPEETGEEAEATRAPEDERLGVGDSVEAEGVRATLNGVRVLPTTELDLPLESPDNLFVAPDLTFENVSDRPVSVSSLLEFVLKNEEGYSASQSIHSQQRQLAEGEIEPGQRASGEIVYEVPPESRGLQLDYRPFLRGDIHTWYVGDVGALPRGCYELAQTWLANAENSEPTQNRVNRGTRILMRFSVEFITRSRAEGDGRAPAPEAPAASEAVIAEAAEDYYQAVDQENWAYTYENLDSQTQALFAEDEWYLKNQFFADTEGLELSSMDVTVNGSPSASVVGVTVYRTFKDGTSITRDTLFVQEGGVWKHRFTQEEIEIFMPGTPYEEFVALQQA